MKTQIKRFSKSALAVVLTLCMLVSCMTVGIIATNAAQSQQERLGAVDDSQAVGADDKIIFVELSASWAASGSILLHYWGGANLGDASLSSYSGSIYTATIPADSTGMKLHWNNGDWYGSDGDSTTKNYAKLYESSGAKVDYGTYQVTSTASLSASKTSATTDENVTLTPGISSNTTYNAYKSVSYSISPSSGASISGNTFTATSAGTYTVTATVTYNAKGFTGITKTATATKKITVTAAATTYNNIAVAAKGSTDGSTYNTTLSGTPATISANSYTTGSSALNISAGTVSGYTFAQWKVTAGSGTIGSATTANTTFTPSASNTTVTAQYKKNYTFSNGTTDTHGTVTVPSGTVLAGASYSGTVTPADGYKIKTLTVGGVAVSAAAGKTFAYTYSGTTGSSTTGTSTPISVVATFEANTAMNLYIAGRFRVRPSAGSSSWTTTYASGSDWNATSTNIPFTYLSGTTYKVDTYASLAELSAKIGSSSYTGDPVFFVYDTTNSKNWYASSATTMSTSGTTLVSSGGANSNLKFSSTSTDSPVTIYYDSNTHKIWYTIPDYYDVTVVEAAGGSVTASPTRAEAGTEITLTVSPATGYELTSLTAKDSDNTTVTITSNKFTMPAKNVTVTPVFSKKKFSGLTAVGKYTEDGTNYNKSFSTNPVSIASTSATQLDGTTVTAPATVTVSGVKYNFVDFVATNGSVTNAATSGTNKTTTFKPSAASAVCTARYKKVYTITSSVDDTGTGAGTVSTNKTEVEAGGSYTITATAKSGSAIESIKVNGSAVSSPAASKTISSVSADQTVVVKFKSNVYLRGGSTIGTNWITGDAMTSNAAGTEFTKTYSNVLGSSEGTSYEFKLYNGTSYSDDSSATVTITGSTSTGTMVTKAAAGVNWKLNLKKNANITIKSDGTKITEIKVVPADSTKYAVTFKKADNTTITGQYEGTNFSTALADATVQVYAGDEISYEVKAADGYYIKSLDGVSGFTANTTYNGKLTVNSATTITPTVAQLLSITAKSNKSDRGTVTIKSNKSTVFPGEKITVIVSPKNGVLKTLTYSFVKNSVTYIFECNLTTKAWTQIQPPINNSSLNSAKLDVATVTALMYDFFNKSGDALGAVANDEVLGADTEYPLTLDSNATGNITVNATFDAYSGESTWYYNGYDTSGNAVSGYHARQMTEAMVGGEKFSYYEVSGRTGTDDQLMTVYNGAASSGTRYVYFTASAGGGWSTDENHQYAYFYNNSGNAGSAWPGDKMTKYTTNEYGQNVYRVEIPTSSSPTGVVFNNASYANHKTTDVTDLTKGGYYLLSTHHNDNGTEIHDWQSYDCTYPSAGYSTGTEYFYQNSTHNGDYTGDFNTKGFHNHKTASKEFAKPKDLGTNTGDYYINVLYPNTTYTINGVTKKTGSNPMIIWSAEPLAGDDETVKVYAKDGAIRAETFGSTYANIADTKIYAADGTTTVGTKQSGSITNQTYETYKAAKGDTIVIKTTIGATDTGTLSDAADLKAKYYVRGFCVNGEVSQLLEPTNDGVYTLTYKVPEDYEGKNIEITPIYYLKDTEANPIVTYRVTGFTDALKAVGSGKPGWGDTLYTYPFYGKLGGQNNAFGAYPGQPMVYYEGQYQMQIPQSDTAWDPSGVSADTIAATHVSGVTMSNGYWDSVHKTIMGYGDNSSSADHVQTYDYGDFYKIFNEKKPVDNIVFDFKYRTTTHNLVTNAPSSPTPNNLTSTYKNGFELLTNFHGRNVDLFGDPLSGDAADPSKTKPLYVVSIGGVKDNVSGVENIAGYYATEWKVFAPNLTTGTPASSDAYKLVSTGNKNSIPPEVLVLNNNSTSFNNTTYPSADASHQLTNWQELYTALETYRGRPVMISYEAADAQQAQGMYYTGTGGATRNDGRWLYSKNGENITSKIKIQYSNDNGKNYNDLNTTNPQVEGLSAYFTNDGVEGQMTYSTTIDPDKTFDFEAKTTNADYKFVGWFMEDGTKITTDNASHTERSGSYTFVAKFMKVESGQLILSHSVDTNDTYKGAGTAKISAVVKNGDEVVRTYDLSTSDITLDDKIIKSDSAYTIEVTLEATATGQDTLGTTVLANPSGQDLTYFNAASTTTEGKTKTIVLNSFNVASLFSGTTQNVKNIIYHSYFKQVTFHYDLKFEYTDRFGVTKGLYKKGYLTSAQAANENYVKVYDVGNDRNERRLMPAFIEQIAPHVSNFGETITWKIVETGYAFSVQDYEYTLTNVVLANQTKNDKRNVTFNLPYLHTNGIASVDGNKQGTAATTTNFELTGDNAVTYSTIPTLLNDAENGIYTDADKKHWIAAPATINDNGTTKYFQYWSVKRTSASGENDPELARCYFPGFNFVVLENYTITAIYGNQATSISDSGVYTGASYLETSRNQWNTKADSDSSDKDTNGDRIAADLLFNDFVLNYNYKGAQLNANEDNGAVQELGVVVERIRELDINQDGSKNTNISNYSSEAENRNTVLSVINNTSSDKKFTKNAIAKTALDNKNRYQFYDAFYNGAGWSLDKQSSATKYAYKNYVFRAYTYIKYTDDQGQTQICLSEKPTYFTMYDEAVADYVAPKTSSTNP